MNLIERFLTIAIVAFAAGLPLMPLVAQDAQTAQRADAGAKSDPNEQANAETPSPSAGLSIDQVKADLEALEANASIDDAAKTALRGKYKLAINHLQDAAANEAAEAEYRSARDSAADEAGNLRQQLGALPTAQQAARVETPGTIEEVQKEITRLQADLGGLNEALSKAQSDLTRVKARPAEINARMPKARTELDDIQSKLASPDFAKDVTSPERVAQRSELQAAETKLKSELAMLREEQLSQSARQELLQAQNDLLSRQVENATTILKQLQATAHNSLVMEARQVETVIKDTKEDLLPSDGKAQQLADEVQELAREFDGVVENIRLVSDAKSTVENRVMRLDREFKSLKGLLDTDPGGGAMAQVLFDMQDQLLDANIFGTVSGDAVPTLEGTRLAKLEAQRKLRSQQQLEQDFAGRSSKALNQLLVTRQQVLEKLAEQYEGLIPALSALDGQNQELEDKVRQVRKYVREKLVWVRSSATLSVADLTAVPSGLRWLFSRQHWQEVGLAFQGIAHHAPLRCAATFLIVMGLLVTRRRTIPWLEQTGIVIRRISTDRYALTGQALICTILLALPLSVLVGFLAWSIDWHVRHEPQHSAWLRGLSDGLRDSVWITVVLSFTAALSRPAGLADAHFGFRTEPLARIRRSIIIFAALYVPAMLIASSTLYGDASKYSGSVGRVTFLFTHGWIAVVFWQLLAGRGGILGILTSEFPNRWLTRTRYLWGPLLVACPLGLAAFAWRGYFVTAIELSVGLLATLGVVVAADVLYWMCLRWFWIKKRRLELAERMEKWRARREAEEETEDGGEMVAADAEEDGELDLESVGDQTRNLIRFLFVLGTLAAIVLLWRGKVPVLPILESIPVGGNLSLLELTKAIIIAVVTWMGVKNLPGVLELSVLRGTTIEAGTRFAIATLCQYAATAVGVLALCSVIQLDWSKFGWIAAALSVGLGFGLQEVVANFVCGLILLFERPIRVGDIVTLEGTTGTVTRIHLRSTTITNWDRQDFVVPNKNLITGTILNWTLSAAINRIVIPVGVAYGTDTELARRILLEVATEHPLILNEPAPSANFEQFADSSLTLILRGYLPDLDNRLSTITELHTEIDRRFAEAGIEIAFPQQDLHIRSGLEKLAAEKQDRTQAVPFEH